MEAYRAANIHGIDASDLGLCSRHRYSTIGRIVSGAAFELTAKVSDDTHPEGRRKESRRSQRIGVMFSFHYFHF